MLNEDQILELAVTLGSATKALIAEALLPVLARVAELETAAKAAAKTSPEYLGVHVVGRSYSKNAFVTAPGGVWAALRSTQQKPGDGPDWQLAVRAGRDGRDAR